MERNRAPLGQEFRTQVGSRKRLGWGRFEMGIVEKGLRLRNWSKRSHFKEKKILNKNEKQRAREKARVEMECTESLE